VQAGGVQLALLVELAKALRQDALLRALFHLTAMRADVRLTIQPFRASRIVLIFKLLVPLLLPC
jgi:hypothetical protein